MKGKEPLKSLKHMIKKKKNKKGMERQGQGRAESEEGEGHVWDRGSWSAVVYKTATHRWDPRPFKCEAAGENHCYWDPAVEGSWGDKFQEVLQIIHYFTKLKYNTWTYMRVRVWVYQCTIYLHVCKEAHYYENAVKICRLKYSTTSGKAIHKVQYLMS